MGKKGGGLPRHFAGAIDQRPGRIENNWTKHFPNIF